MFHPRNLLIIFGVLLLSFGGWFAWRAAHPPLSDEQQIAANIKAIRLAVEARSARRIAYYLADDFTWNGHNKREINSQLTGTFFQWREVTAMLTKLQVTVHGNAAIATGKFSLSLRPSPNARAVAYLGDFKLTWKKRDGQWLLTKAEGKESEF
jgi:ketosteroid isomerase-like protein